MFRRTDDLRITDVRPLIPPAILLEEIPISERASNVVANARTAIANAIDGRDPRLVVIAGPCSIHDQKAALEYANRLQRLATRYADHLIVVMRCYFEKPRTTVGWKGFINDPDLDESFHINKGLRLARQLLLDVNDMGLPTGSEFLDTQIPQHIADLTSWVAIGARTTESQVHRELASGLSMPVGFKNGTDGNTKTAVDAVLSARTGHWFPSVTKQGVSAIFQTTGNESCHVILRGGSRTGPNYHAASVTELCQSLAKQGLRQAVMVDCSHGNSDKDHRRQGAVAADLCQQVSAGSWHVFGLMLESHLIEGRQDYVPGRESVYGQSITDGCISLEQTEPLLEQLAKAQQLRGIDRSGVSAASAAAPRRFSAMADNTPATGFAIAPPVEPMLAKLAEALPEAGAFLFEPKWDGFRAIVFRGDADVFIQSRDLRPLDRYFPELHAMLLTALPPGCVVDGEIVIAGPDGLDFDRLQLRLHPAASRVAKLAAETPSAFVAFDLLAVGGQDIRELPQHERRARLERLLADAAPPLHLTPMTHDCALATEWLARFEGAGLDGVMAKPVDANYQPGKRAMFKIKHARTADCVVAGFRWHKSGNDRVGSLLLGLYDDRGGLQHVGVTSAFTMAVRQELAVELAPLRVDALDGHPWRDWAAAQPEAGRKPGAQSRWSAGKDLSWEPLRIERVCEVKYDHLQGDRFRHATVFQRWRPDKAPADCRYDQLEVTTPYELAKVFGAGQRQP